MRTVLTAITAVLLASAAPAQSDRLTEKDVEHYRYQANSHRPWSTIERWVVFERSARPPRNDDEREYRRWRRQFIRELKLRSTPPELAAGVAQVYEMIGQPSLAAEMRLRLAGTVKPGIHGRKRRRKVRKALNDALVNAGCLSDPALTERVMRQGRRIFPDETWIDKPHGIVDYFSEREVSRVKSPLPRVMQSWQSMLISSRWFCWKKEAIRAVAMLGKPAPELAVDHVVGASSKPVLAELRGKVVLLDLRRYSNQGSVDPEDVENMRKLVLAHPRDLQVIGVRCLTGRFCNREMGILPDYGNPAKMTADEELACWRKLHVHYRLPWPYIFECETKRSKNRERYPGATYVLIDRAGRVRYMHWSDGGIYRITKAAEKLLAEAPAGPQ